MELNKTKQRLMTITFHERGGNMETVLIEKSIKGDVESFEQLIIKYNRYVYNIAFRMMGNEEDAKDMAQESLIKAFKSISTFKENAQFSTWLYRITLNTCKDELRKRKGNLVSLDEEAGEQLTVGDKIQSSTGNPVIIYEQHELKENIQSALNTLSEENRSVVILKDVMGYSYEEIGAILEIPIGTVRSKLNRSRLALRSILQIQLAEH